MLSALLLVLGYFAVLYFVMTHVNGGGSISTVAAIVLLVYGCAAGLLILLAQYFGEPGLLVFAVAWFYSLGYWAWRIYRAFKEKPRVSLGASVALIAYLLLVLYVTIFIRKSGSNFQVQMELCNWLREDGIENFEHILLNAAMFFPVGILFSFVTAEKRGRVISAGSFGLLVSVLIETGQLLLHSGTCDVDDVLSNGLGAFLGALIVAVILRRKNISDG